MKFVGFSQHGSLLGFASKLVIGALAIVVGVSVLRSAIQR